MGPPKPYGNVDSEVAAAAVAREQLLEREERPARHSAASARKLASRQPPAPSTARSRHIGVWKNVAYGQRSRPRASRVVAGLGAGAGRQRRRDGDRAARGHAAGAAAAPAPPGVHGHDVPERRPAPAAACARAPVRTGRVGDRPSDTMRSTSKPARFEQPLERPRREERQVPGREHQVPVLEVAPGERPLDVAGGEHEQPAGARRPGRPRRAPPAGREVLDHVPHRHDVELPSSSGASKISPVNTRCPNSSRAYCAANSETSTPVTS